MITAMAANSRRSKTSRGPVIVGRPMGSRSSRSSETTEAAAATMAGPSPHGMAMATTIRMMRCSKTKAGRPSQATMKVTPTGMATAAA